MHRIAVVNGPNLNMLGKREPEVYGSTTLDELEEQCRSWGSDLGVEVETFQSNHEGALIDFLHSAEADGFVFNPGALSHTSYALHDALTSIAAPTVEVHISNIRKREEWRRGSVTAPACVHAIYGRGITGYRDALSHLVHRSRHSLETLAYGELPDQFADVRTPGEGRHPGVLLVHGGMWRHHLARDLTDRLAVDLTDRGYTTYNVEYRRVDGGGGGVDTLGDVRAAVRAAAGDSRSESLKVIGHEAGGLLALLAAAPREVDLCVALGGITDLLAARQDRLGDGAVAEFLAGSPPEALSPLNRLPVGVPVVLFHGNRDPVVPVGQSETFAAAAREAGDTVELRVLEGADSEGFLDPASSMWAEVLEAIAG